MFAADLLFIKQAGSHVCCRFAFYKADRQPMFAADMLFMKQTGRYVSKMYLPLFSSSGR